jgi:hypothetical protein
MFILDQEFDLVKINKLRHVQKLMCIPLTDTVPPSSVQPSKLGSASVGNAGDFMSLFITGSFETLSSQISGGTPYIIDDGVDYLKGQFKDTIGSKVLSTEHIPFSILFTPGRRRSPLATNNFQAPFVGCSIASAPNQLFYPMDWNHLYQSTTIIQIDVINSSNTPISYDICFWGVLINQTQGV